jgi:hypothetical protein
MSTPSSIRHPVTLTRQILFDWSSASTSPTSLPDEPKVVPQSPPVDPKAKSSTHLAVAPKTFDQKPLKFALEHLLRDRKIPYVDVHDAAKALPQQTTNLGLCLFHFVVYRTQAPNWLVLAGAMSERRRKNMQQWEHLFGEGFIAVNATRDKTSSIHFQCINGEELVL